MVEQFVTPQQQGVLQQGVPLQQQGIGLQQGIQKSEYINVPQGLPHEGLGLGTGYQQGIPLQQGFQQGIPLQQGIGLQQGLGLQQGFASLLDQIFMGVDRAVVREKVVDQSLINRFGTQNLYYVELANGIKLVAREKRNRAWASLFNSNEPFTIRVGFLGGSEYQDFLGLRRPRKTLLGGNSLKVMDMNKNILGTITKKFSLTSRKFVINDPANNILFTLKAGKTLGKGTFEIFNNRIDKKATVGELRKEWSQDWWTGKQQWGTWAQPQQGYQQGFTGTQQPAVQQSHGIGHSIKNALHIGQHNQQPLQQQPLQQGYQQPLQQGFQQPLQQGYVPAYSEDTYALQFPWNSLSSEKALILCATFLIDFVFFNQNQQ
jgi:hypothetical protein